MQDNKLNPVFIFILKHFKINLFVSVIGLILIIIYVFFFMEKYYTSKASLLPSETGLSSSLGGALGSIANLTGIMDMGSGIQTPEMYVGIIGSRKLQDAILDMEFSVEYEGRILRQKYIDYMEIDTENSIEKRENAYKLLNNEIIYTDIDADNSILSIEVTEKYPVLASQLADSIISVLNDIVQYKLNSEYIEQSKYLNDRLRTIQDSLYLSENNYKRFLEINKIIEDPKNIIIDMQLRRNITVYTTIFSELRKQQEVFILKNMVRLSPVKVLDSASIPFRKSRPKRVLVTISLTVILLFIIFAFNAGLLIYKNKKNEIYEYLRNK
ncbi:MAG: hypothetical protein JXR46_01385 [Calditrichaceae bacterium]|nr:hypothetical protein [Calditrichaceae bacterium]MBN2707670.1 hypothetical protein [Calditrichaceae bacterium]RQV94850.1 MAG: hypothetical protein EH224_09265 [Calditrichota bacterium]